MKKLSSFIICSFLMLAMTAKAEATFDLSTGTGTGIGWTWSAPILTINDGAIITITGTRVGQIRVTANASANITLEHVTLNRHDSPILINSGASVSITLVGVNTLTAGVTGGGAGVQVPLDATLTIGGTGNLTTKGSFEGAGIGGVDFGNAGTIIINSGTITATSGWSGAGIGGGRSGAGGNISINGGTVTATSPGPGDGIGGGSSTANVGTFTMNGNAVVFTSKIGDTNTSRRANGMLFVGNIGRVYGNIEIPDDLTVLNGYRLLIPTYSTLIVPNGTTLTNNGAVHNCGTINIYGAWIGNEPVIGDDNTINMDIENPVPPCDGSWTFANNVYTIFDDANVTITGISANERRIEIAAGANVNITLEYVIIEGLGNNQSPFLLNSGAEVTLTLLGENTLIAGNNRAGIQTTDATLTIDGTGSLTATGGIWSPGIGGMEGDIRSGIITINGGTVTAIGGVNGTSAAGIGGGNHSAGATAIINGGVVTAIGGGASSGIGGSGQNFTPGPNFLDMSDPGTLTMNGNAVIFTNSVGDTNTSRRTSGILFIGNNGTFYGESVTIATDVIIPANRSIAIPEGATLTIAENATLANNGVITNSGTIVNNGTITNNETIRAMLTVVDGGEGATATDFQNFGELITLNEGTKVGYVIDEWVSADVIITDNQFTMLYNAVTVMASWETATYTVTFNSQGGTNVADQTIEHGGTATVPIPPTRAGYTFGGWFRETNTINAWNFTIGIVTSDTTLFARWTPETGTNIADISPLNMSIHPNPFTNKIHITNAEIGSTLTLYVLNATGNIVHTQRVTNSTETIQLGHLPNGVYILRIGEQSVRIVKQ